MNVANESNSVGVLGGTFDPVHYGHLTLAADAAAQLNLAEVRFIPTGTPPHRAAPLASAKARVDMLKLALAGKPCFKLDAREILRQGASYTVDTLCELRQELGAACPLYLLLGADAFSGLGMWHRWQDLFALTHIAVAPRQGFTFKDLPPAIASEFAKRRTTLPHAVTGSIVVLHITPVEVSASMIREHLAEGKGARNLLPPLVFDYIRTNHMYAVDA